MTARRLRRRAMCIALAPASVLLLVGCSPPNDVEVGLNEVHTNVVFGATAKDAPPETSAPAAPPPPRNFQFSAPSFIAPPAPIQPVAKQPTTPTTPPVACPSAGLFDLPKPAAHQIEGRPKQGVYPFDQKGSFQLGQAAPVQLPAETERTIRAVQPTDNGGYQYEQIVRQFGAETTTQYRFVTATNPLSQLGAPGTSNPAGIYIGSVQTKRPDGKVEQIELVYPGLRIFPNPSDVGVIWDSAAVDAGRGSALRLTGTVRERFRVDACGDLVEGWRSEVQINVTTPESNYLVKADYIVVPQLGGLIAADKIDISGVYHGQVIRQTSEATVRKLSPVRAR